MIIIFIKSNNWENQRKIIKIKLIDRIFNFIFLKKRSIFDSFIKSKLSTMVHKIYPLKKELIKTESWKIYYIN